MDVYDKVNETLYEHYGIKFNVNAETQPSIEED